MNRKDSPVVRLSLRLSGLLLLAAALTLAHHLILIGPRHAGAEPAGVYLLALLAFLGASAGGVLACYGERLFGRVPVAPRWASRDADGRDGSG